MYKYTCKTDISDTSKKFVMYWQIPTRHGKFEKENTILLYFYAFIYKSKLRCYKILKFWQTSEVLMTSSLVFWLCLRDLLISLSPFSKSDFKLACCEDREQKRTQFTSSGICWQRTDGNRDFISLITTAFNFSSRHTRLRISSPEKHFETWLKSRYLIHNNLPLF